MKDGETQLMPNIRSCLSTIPHTLIESTLLEDRDTKLKIFEDKSRVLVPHTGFRDIDLNISRDGHCCTYDQTIKYGPSIPCLLLSPFRAINSQSTILQHNPAPTTCPKPNLKHHSTNSLSPLGKPP
jgi:hypothetical protein